MAISTISDCIMEEEPSAEAAAALPSVVTTEATAEPDGPPAFNGQDGIWDLLQAAIRAAGIADLPLLASRDARVLEFCQRLCFYLQEAKAMVQRRVKGQPPDQAVDQLLMHAYVRCPATALQGRAIAGHAFTNGRGRMLAQVPFIINYHHYVAAEQYPNEPLHPGVSHFSAGLCLMHMLTTRPDQAKEDLILRPLYSLPPLPASRLIQSTLMIIHCRSCQQVRKRERAGFCSLPPERPIPNDPRSFLPRRFAST